MKKMSHPVLAATCLVVAVAYLAIWSPVVFGGSIILSIWEANVGLILAVAVPVVIFAPAWRWVLLVVLWLGDSLKDEVVASFVHRAPVDPASLVLVLVPGVALGLAYWRAQLIDRDKKERVSGRLDRTVERAERAVESLPVATPPPTSRTTPWAVLAVVLLAVAFSGRGHRKD